MEVGSLRVILKVVPVESTGTLVEFFRFEKEKKRASIINPFDRPGQSSAKYTRFSDWSTSLLFIA